MKTIGEPFIEVLEDYFLLRIEETGKEEKIFYKDISNIYFINGRKNWWKMIGVLVLMATESAIGNIELEQRGLYVVFKVDRPTIRCKVPVANSEIEKLVKIIKKRVKG